MNMRFAWFSVDGSAGLLKFLGRKTLELFHMSAYSTAFFFSIAARELLGGHRHAVAFHRNSVSRGIER
jgi:hypothetical protein